MGAEGRVCDPEGDVPVLGDPEGRSGAGARRVAAVADQDQGERGHDPPQDWNVGRIRHAGAPRVLAILERPGV